MLDDKNPAGSSREVVRHDSGTDFKRTAGGIVLVPQPSDDPVDPLNWSLTKKVVTLSIVSAAAAIGMAQMLANQSGFFVQGRVYRKTPVQMSYSISAAIVGGATGPLLWTPLAQRLGKSSVILWGVVATMACCIWSASMTGADDYVPFVISRWLSGTFGSAASCIGAGTIIDIFYLHQRGKAFTCYTLATLLGVQLGPTLGGYIVNSAPWPLQFWWTVGVQGAVIILVFLFLDETTFARQTPQYNPRPPKSRLANRIATFFPGTKIIPRDPARQSPWLDSILIGLCPVTLITGAFLLIAFGWLVAVTTLLSVYLQSPISQGGYGFSPLENATFTFSQWIALLVAELYGVLFNDRVPLWLCRRRGGLWKPEYRLYPLLLPPAIILPIGLGLFGACLEYGLHYMVLALATFLINFCELAMVPVAINYVVESFVGHASEVNTILHLYRVILGLLVPFFITPWQARVGPGWVFGMMAFFTILGFSLTVVLAWRGPVIRQYSIKRFMKSEEGVKLVKDESKEELSEKI